MILAAKTFVTKSKWRFGKAYNKVFQLNISEAESFFLLRERLRKNKSYRPSKKNAGYIQTKRLRRPLDLGRLIKVIADYKEVECITPAIYEIADQQKLTFKVDKRCIYAFANATVLCGTDLVILNEQAYWDKSYYPNRSKNIFKDYHLLSFEGSTVKLLHPREKIVVENGVSLMGVYANYWSHFLCEQFEKLDHLESLPVASNQLSILVQKGIDPHIRYLIETKTKHLGCKIIEVCHSQAVQCSTFYHIDRGAILTDHAEYTSINDIIIRPEVAKYVHCLSVNEKRQDLRLFIGRENGRNITNYAEIKRYFIDNGFKEIFPHKLNIYQKIEMFGRASHIAGPGSSGFANAVFCQEGTKIVFFINYARIFDMLMTGLLRNYKVDCWHLSGLDEDKSSINSSYYLPLKKVQAFVTDTGFLD